MEFFLPGDFLPEFLSVLPHAASSKILAAGDGTSTLLGMPKFAALAASPTPIKVPIRFAMNESISKLELIVKLWAKTRRNTEYQRSPEKDPDGYF